MSDLQVSLIIIGIIIIIGVAIFNWMQQLRYRRKIESTLNQKHADVLLEKTSNSTPKKGGRDKIHERIEPQLDKSFYTGKPLKNEFLKKMESGFSENLNEAQENLDQYNNLIDDKAPIPATNELYSIVDGFDSHSNYIVNIYANSVIPANELNELLHRKFDFNKPLNWFGQKSTNDRWEEINMKSADHSGFINLKGCLLLADRAGPIREIDLSIFRDTVQDFAKQINAKTECPDIVPSHEQAARLDKFCADVDVMIGVNIISKDEGAFVGTKIRGLAEASGFKLETDGIFKYRNDENHILFTLINYEPEPFIPDSIRTITTHGITFLLDVPRVANGEKVFDQMTHLAKVFSNTLGGIMVDDNRVPLSENGLARSKQQLINIQSRMRKYNILPGSQNALRLFN
ncbi:MAG: cell division protein ZipA C-terminal FtsZ-binding domain-containing protein [Nitrosomonas sp.]|nr:cell division protein ZipA C-terminal FtsZ-binding domain-containing protein [Nitrosomonas sp.]